MSEAKNGPEYATFFGVMGATSAMIFSGERRRGGGSGSGFRGTPGTAAPPCRVPRVTSRSRNHPRAPTGVGLPPFSLRLPLLVGQGEAGASPEGTPKMRAWAWVGRRWGWGGGCRFHLSPRGGPRACKAG